MRKTLFRVALLMGLGFCSAIVLKLYAGSPNPGACIGPHGRESPPQSWRWFQVLSNCSGSESLIKSYGGDYAVFPLSNSYSAVTQKVEEILHAFLRTDVGGAVCEKVLRRDEMLIATHLGIRGGNFGDRSRKYKCGRGTSDRDTSEWVESFSPENCVKGICSGRVYDPLQGRKYIILVRGSPQDNEIQTPTREEYDSWSESDTQETLLLFTQKELQDERSATLRLIQQLTHEQSVYFDPKFLITGPNFGRGYSFQEPKTAPGPIFAAISHPFISAALVAERGFRVESSVVPQIAKELGLDFRPSSFLSCFTRECQISRIIKHIGGLKSIAAHVLFMSPHYPEVLTRYEVDPELAENWWKLFREYSKIPRSTLKSYFSPINVFQDSRFKDLHEKAFNLLRPKVETQLELLSGTILRSRNGTSISVLDYLTQPLFSNVQNQFSHGPRPRTCSGTCE